LFYCRTGR
jgi:hypothetical protein